MAHVSARAKSNLARKSQRKKQTRLAFDPVQPGSSSTISPARIRYESASSPAKTFDLTSPVRSQNDVENFDSPSVKKHETKAHNARGTNGRLHFKSLSTPVASSQPEADDEVYKDSAGMETKRNSRGDPVSRLRRMTRSSKATQGEVLAGTTTVISRKRTQQAKSFGKTGDDSSAGSSPEIEQPTRGGTGIAKPKRKPPTLPSITISDDDINAGSPIESPTLASLRRGKALRSKFDLTEKSHEPRKGSTSSFLSSSNRPRVTTSKLTPPSTRSKFSGSGPGKSRTEVEARRGRVSTTSDEDDIHVLPTPRRTRGYGSRRRPSDFFAYSDDSDREPLSSHKKSSRAPALDLVGSDDSELPDISRITARSGRNEKAPFTRGASSEDEEDIVVRSSAKRRFRMLGPQQGSTKDKDKEEESEQDIDSDLVISSPLKRRRVLPKKDSANEPLTSPLKRLRQGSLSHRKGPKEDEDASSKRVTRQQRQKKPHRSAREKKLELLKRQRAGEKITQLTSSGSENEEPQRGLYDTDSGLEILSNFEDEDKDDGEDAIEEVRQSLRQPRHFDDDDFVVDDEDAPLGVPHHGLHEIPLEFTHQAHKPLKEHFKDAVEWMVQNKLNPGFNREDPIYAQAFKKLDDEVRGYASSIYSSAAWKEAFTRALWARPIIREQDINPDIASEERKCDACGRTNHPARFEIYFEGKAYYNDTLEEVESEDGNDEEEDAEDSNGSNKVSVNSAGHEIPSQDTAWYVGRFCAANASTAHTLIHWKYALNSWTIDTLRVESHLSPTALAQRIDWSQKRRSEYANAVVDGWEAAGEIKALYRDFRNNLEVARKGKAKGRWDK